uniref:Uncharacterized protein n=1 Tax=Strombidium rassoulzadegani TaxID=1082188 RepID=A0A7S3CUB9_9SPIT|mmetsp:Transcript_9596/g.16122  ORF Transcript_9596/g.16122 Transcript_9596/m.16122 type:complete len:156 (+) Transcript_9596:143-610(+)
MMIGGTSSYKQLQLKEASSTTSNSQNQQNVSLQQIQKAKIGTPSSNDQQNTGQFGQNTFGVAGAMSLHAQSQQNMRSGKGMQNMPVGTVMGVASINGVGVQSQNNLGGMKSSQAINFRQNLNMSLQQISSNNLNNNAANPNRLIVRNPNVANDSK